MEVPVPAWKEQKKPQKAKKDRYVEPASEDESAFSHMDAKDIEALGNETGAGTSRSNKTKTKTKTPERQLGKLRLSSSKDQRKTADHDREVAIQKERDRHERLYQEQDLGRKLRKWSTKPIKENLDPLVKTNKKIEALNDKDGYESKSGQIPMKEYKKLLRNVGDDRRDSKMSNSQKKENLERYKKMVKKINSQRDLPGWWPLARSLNELDEEHSYEFVPDDEVYGFDKEKCPRLAGEESQRGLQRKRNGEVFQSWI